jgi:dephospho-CoA kinase
MTRIKIGVAGYMGSGKSTFAQYLSKNGGTVFDADLIAKEIMNKNTKIKNQLAEKFGDAIISNDNIQFDLLSKICFSSKSNLATLNAIVHKPLIKHLYNLIQACRQKTCILDAALISFWQIENWFDIMYWIRTSSQIRLKRLVLKTIIPQKELKKRVELQEALFNEPSEKEWIIVTNEGSLEEFEDTMEKSYNAINKNFTV